MKYLLDAKILSDIVRHPAGPCATRLGEVGEATVIATGGLASLIAPHTRTVQHVEPWLTLHGLRIVHERNHSGATT